MGREGLLAEYAALRKEIIGDQKRIQEIIALNMTVVGLLIGYGFSKIGEISSFYFLSPLVIILPSSIIIATIRTAILEKASYIRLKIEPRVSGMQWESLLYKNRGKLRRTWKIQAINENLLYTAMGFLSVGLFLSLSDIGLVHILTSVLLFALVILVCIIFSIYPITHEKKLEEAWK